jgi:hypothetical protein
MILIICAVICTGLFTMLALKANAWFDTQIEVLNMSKRALAGSADMLENVNRNLDPFSSINRPTPEPPQADQPPISCSVSDAEWAVIGQYNNGSGVLGWYTTYREALQALGWYISRGGTNLRLLAAETARQ